MLRAGVYQHSYARRRKERVATIRVIPFFSCGAKLPILTAIAGGIATMTGMPNPDVITYCMYILGVLVAIAAVILMRATTMKGEVPPFIMELPAYHVPQPKTLPRTCGTRQNTLSRRRLQSSLRPQS